MNNNFFCQRKIQVNIKFVDLSCLSYDLGKLLCFVAPKRIIAFSQFFPLVEKVILVFNHHIDHIHKCLI